MSIMIDSVTIVGCSNSVPYGTVRLKSPIGELKAQLTNEECKAIITMCDAAAVRAAEQAMEQLRPIVATGTTQLVLEHSPVPKTPPQPTGVFDDDIPF
jgi:hypothetical protein